MNILILWSYYSYHLFKKTLSLGSINRTWKKEGPLKVQIVYNREVSLTIRRIELVILLKLNLFL